MVKTVRLKDCKWLLVAASGCWSSPLETAWMETVRAAATIHRTCFCHQHLKAPSRSHKAPLGLSDGDMNSSREADSKPGYISWSCLAGNLPELDCSFWSSLSPINQHEASSWRLNCYKPPVSTIINRPKLSPIVKHYSYLSIIVASSINPHYHQLHFSTIIH